jgi:ATP-dependent Clp protease ATP-binding subunit ClpA
MFERYTERARRLIFFGRYEAAVAGAKYIGIPHLLLALLRESRELFAASERSVEEIRDSIESEFDKSVQSTTSSTDLPLDHAAKRSLAFGAEESERLRHRHIGVPHVFLGMYREDPAYIERHTGMDQRMVDSLRRSADRYDRPEQAQPAANEYMISGSGRVFRPDLFPNVPQERRAVLDAVAQALTESAVTIQIITPRDVRTFSFGPNRNPDTESPEGS